MTMSKLRTKITIVFLISIVLASCSLHKNRELMILKDSYSSLKLNTNNLQFSFSDEKGNILVPKDDVSGIYINESPIASSQVETKSANEITLNVESVKGEKAKIEIAFENGIAKISVVPSIADSKISLRVGGMPLAHGLGDAGAWGENFNLVENKKQTYDIINDGGGRRWVSTFTIFPRNNCAAVFFDKGKKNVFVSDSSYQMNIEANKKAEFYLLLGDTKEIYANYKKIRQDKGFKDVQPKARLFELGWESWDALGWNTNQETVKNILGKFHENGYPIRWAVTGSGFWDEGGTTTSFGRWGKKFSKADEFKNWMHANDIKWMIGLRTNIIPNGGPYYPKTKKRDKNLKVRSFYGNEIADVAVANNYLLSDHLGQAVKMTSSVFPIVPCYLVDGDKEGASKWYQKQYSIWGVDGIKEDTMMDLGEETGIFNGPISKLSDEGALVMARCGNYSAPGTLLRINDTGVYDMSKRIPINYMQYAACAAPNVYSDVAGVHNMHNLKDIDRSIRQTWLLSSTAGLAVGAFPGKWPVEKQNVFKKAIDFHYQITPYLYSAGEKSYQTGYPYTLTPLSIAYPKDMKANTNNFQWMIGESLMATPLLKNHESGKMDVYLPEGVWYDWETGEKFQGPIMLYDFELPINKTPCFVGGKGVVLLRDKQDQLSLRIYDVNKKSTSTFYTMEGADKYTVQVKKNNLDNVEVWDTTEKKKIIFMRELGGIEFGITEGHSYEIR